MPFFRWTGITIVGDVKRGVIQVSSQHMLDKRLLEQGIALISRRVLWWYPTLYLPIKKDHVKELFGHVTTLLSSGILLPHALDIVSEQLASPLLQETMYKVAHEVHAGVPLHKALRAYSAVFTPLMVQVVCIGEETGALSKATAYIHMLLEDELIKKNHVHAMLLVPVITACSLVCMIFFLLGVVIPHFAAIFTSIKVPLPPITRTMLWLSTLFSISHIIFYSSMVGILGMLCYFLIPKKTMSRYCAYACMRTPYLGSLWMQYQTSQLYMHLSVLLQGGTPLLSALHIVRDGMHNILLHEALEQIVDQVTNGVPLSVALRCNETGWVFKADTIALLRTGEETGLLVSMIQQASTIEYLRYKQGITKFFTLLQPLLLLLLGAVVLLLLVAVYEPIMTLSYAV